MAKLEAAILKGATAGDCNSSSVAIFGCIFINHPFWGTSIFGNTHIDRLLELQPFNGDVIG